ncbi:Sister chromatid cohesion protein 2 [Tieghemiomyces parasiticus]|uniref:Sister chromatid cohesion protein n=1 Tax=Tieghemiomyces parasiticus TaxID=78921 RepID=A0A9W8AEN2_9FUNG|nr:Sister chromatid cohesion protein 2 [Tieghemiomyces parasiticus]
MTRYDVDSLARLLKLLEPSVRRAEGVDLTAVMEAALPDVGPDGLTSEKASQALEVSIRTVANGLEAAVCVTTILTAHGLPKRLYHEDTLATTLEVLRGVLLGFASPVVGVGDLAPAGRLTTDPRLKRMIAGLISGAQALLDGWAVLLTRHSFSDAIVIAAGYLAVPMVFIDTVRTDGPLTPASAAALRLGAVAALRALYARYPVQRVWILEEVLTSLLRVPTAVRAQRPFKVADARPLPIVSALILQLLHSCTEGSGPAAEVCTHDDGGGGDDPALWLTYCRTNLEAAAAGAGTVIKFLLHRGARGKAGNAAEYRTALEHLAEDALGVLGHPDWPAAELLLRVLVKHLLAVADDRKADPTLKALAVDQLGAVAARLHRWPELHATGETDGPTSDPTGNGPTEASELERSRLTLVTPSMRQIPPGEITASTAVRTVHQLWDDQRVVLAALLPSGTVSAESAAAASFYLNDWLVGSYTPLTKLTDDNFDESLPEVLRQLLARVGRWYQAQLVRTWTGPSIPNSAERDGGEVLAGTEACPLALAETLASRSPLYNSFDAILARILAALDLSAVALRTKALRALGQIVGHYPALLAQPNVKVALNQRLSDSSPAVRDAAVELVGRYLAGRPALVPQYYPALSARILDTGVSVRKRVLRLLRDVYTLDAAAALRVDLADRVLHRLHDEDPATAQLAARTLQDLWFPADESPSDADLEPAVGAAAAFRQLPPAIRARLTDRIGVLLGVIERGTGELLGEALTSLLQLASDTERLCLVWTYTLHVEALMDHLLGLDEAADRIALARGATLLHHFCAAQPTLITEAHLLALTPYLKDGAGDTTLLPPVLRTVQLALPALRHPAPALLADVEKELLSLLGRAPQPVLNVAVPCLCRVVADLTRTYAYLTRVLRSCADQLGKAARNLAAGRPLGPAKPVMRLLVLLGLLCRHFDFDAVRAKHPDRFPELHAYPEGQVKWRAFEHVVAFTRATLPRPVRLVALQSLGHLFLAYPTMMLHNDSRALMDRIMRGDNEDDELRLQLLRGFAEYLTLEQRRLAAQAGGSVAAANSTSTTLVDLSVLIGNAQELGEAGIGSSLMQCYLDDIIRCVLSPSQSLKLVATDVIACILTQGLAHPLKCVPILVALQTDPHLGLRDKATKLHVQLSTKFASFIHSRTIDAVRQAFEYQVQLKRTVDVPVTGYYFDHREGRPRARVENLYGLLRDKKGRRNDFLHAVVRTFDLDPRQLSPDQVDVRFCRFLADTLFSLDYKLLEEALYVIYCIQRLLAVSGLNLQHQFNHEFAYLTRDDQLTLARVSVCVAMLILVRDALKHTYAISETRCQQYTPSDPGAVKDKYLTRHAAAPMVLHWDRLPYVSKELTTDHDVQVQRLTYCQLVSDVSDAAPGTDPESDMSPVRPLKRADSLALGTGPGIESPDDSRRLPRSATTLPSNQRSETTALLDDPWATGPTFDHVPFRSVMRTANLAKAASEAVGFLISPPAPPSPLPKRAASPGSPTATDESKRPRISPPA